MAKRKLVKNSTHQVYRTSSGEVVPGGSTISGIGESKDGLIHAAWKLGIAGKNYRDEWGKAAHAGTVAHFLIECYLLGEEPDLSEFDSEVIDKGETVYLKFLDWWQKEGLEFIAVEEQLVSDQYRYGGTLDIQARRKSTGNRVLLDTKSSKGIFDNYLYQLAGYENLANEKNPVDIVMERAIIRFGKQEKGDMEIMWMPEMSPLFEVFKAQLNLYHAKKKVPKTHKTNRWEFKAK